MLFTYTGNNTFFLEQSFFDQTGALSVEITSVSETQLVLTHTVFTSANVTVVFKGQGFSVDANGLATSGTITSIEFNGLDIRQATISDINWEAEAFQNALFAVEATSDLTGIAALFNSSGPITIDASNGLTGFDQELTWSNLIPLINQPITFIGSPFDDSVAGASGDDVIDTRSSTSNGDRIAGSEGDDRIIFDLPENSDSPGYYLDYDSIETGMRFDIDGVTNQQDRDLSIPSKTSKTPWEAISASKAPTTMTRSTFGWGLTRFTPLSGGPGPTPTISTWRMADPSSISSSAMSFPAST